MSIAWFRYCVPVLALIWLGSRGQLPSSDSSEYDDESFKQINCLIIRTGSPFQGIPDRNAPLIKKKKTYFQNIWVLLSQFSLGMVSSVSVSTGVVPLFLYPGSSTPVILIPRITVPLIPEKWLLSAGVLIGKMAGNGQSGFAMAYGTTSYGGPGNYISLGIGYGSITGDWAEYPARCFHPPFVARRKWAGSDDCVEYNRGNSLFMISIGGHKWLKHLGVDCGVFIPFFENQPFLVIYPWIGIRVPVHQHSLSSK